jgi:hypothetical protein
MQLCRIVIVNMDTCKGCVRSYPVPQLPSAVSCKRIASWDQFKNAVATIDCRIQLKCDTLF